MSLQPYEHILYEVEDGRARITLNQPKKRNALSLQLVDEFADALWEADDDRAVHCVIIRGAGPAFCSGYDLSQSPVPRREDEHLLQEVDVLEVVFPAGGGHWDRSCRP